MQMYLWRPPGAAYTETLWRRKNVCWRSLSFPLNFSLTRQNTPLWGWEKFLSSYKYRFCYFCWKTRKLSLYRNSSQSQYCTGKKSIRFTNTLTRLFSSWSISSLAIIPHLFCSKNMQWRAQKDIQLWPKQCVLSLPCLCPLPSASSSQPLWHLPVAGPFLSPFMVQALLLPSPFLFCTYLLCPKRHTIYWHIPRMSLD